MEVAIRVLVIFISSFIIHWIFNLVIKNVFRRVKVPSEQYRKRINTIVGVVSNTAGIGIYLIAIMMILSELGLNIAPLITGAGIAGLAFGFGAQTLVKDFISGFFILLENQFNQGDIIKVAGKTGKVSRIGLRTTLIVDEDETRHLIPNSQLGTISILKIEDKDA